jgi:hypothetical protein
VLERGAGWRFLLPSPASSAARIGAVLLLIDAGLATSFERLAPFLVLFANRAASRCRERSRAGTLSSAPRTPDGAASAAAWLLQFAVSIYGGVLRARAIGILMLALFGFLGLRRHPTAANGLKSFSLHDLHQRRGRSLVHRARGAVDWPYRASSSRSAQIVARTTPAVRASHDRSGRSGRSARRVVAIGLAVAVLLFLQRTRI